MSRMESCRYSSSESDVGLFDDNGKSISVRNKKKTQNVSAEAKHFLLGSLASPTEAYS